MYTIHNLIDRLEGVWPSEHKSCAWTETGGLIFYDKPHKPIEGVKLSGCTKAEFEEAVKDKK